MSIEVGAAIIVIGAVCLAIFVLFAIMFSDENRKRHLRNFGQEMPMLDMNSNNIHGSTPPNQQVLIAAAASMIIGIMFVTAATALTGSVLVMNSGLATSLVVTGASAISLIVKKKIG